MPFLVRPTHPCRYLPAGPAGRAPTPAGIPVFSIARASRTPERLPARTHRVSGRPSASGRESSWAPYRSIPLRHRFPRYGVGATNSGSMAPPDLTGSFTTCAAITGSLVGLLCVAIALRYEVIFGPSAPPSNTSVARSAFIALSNALTISLRALCLCSTLRTHIAMTGRRAISMRPTVVSLGLYRVQLIACIVLIAQPHSSGDLDRHPGVHRVRCVQCGPCAQLAADPVRKRPFRGGRGVRGATAATSPATVGTWTRYFVGAG